MSSQMWICMAGEVNIVFSIFNVTFLLQASKGGRSAYNIILGFVDFFSIGILVSVGGFAIP